jgi:hypothetical protein
MTAAHFVDKVLHLPENIGIMMASILDFIGCRRLHCGVITKKINHGFSAFVSLWHVSLWFCFAKNGGLRCQGN